MGQSTKPHPSLLPLLQWFSGARRSFPWRDDPTPYRVLVSEVMLQQTQASRVIPFFLHWMRLFPTFHALASAEERAVIKAWEGLGYYSRARSLHQIAKIIVSEHRGKMPSDQKKLLHLPGIGPYTAGAIRAFAFHERAVAVDANVARVICRLLKVESLTMVPEAVERLLPSKKPWEAMEALIELGALVCKKIPSCSSCPLTSQCDAFQTNAQDRLLVKRASKRTLLWRDVAIFCAKDRVLVIHKEGRQVMSGLYEFPFFETEAGGTSSVSFLKFLQTQVASPLSFISSLPKTTHSFTQFYATLYPSIFDCSVPFFWPDGQWIPRQKLSLLPFSSGHKRILEAFLES